MFLGRLFNSWYLSIKGRKKKFKLVIVRCVHTSHIEEVDRWRRLDNESNNQKRNKLKAKESIYEKRLIIKKYYFRK